MAIADGMAINCSDLQAVGGTRLIAIREWISTDVITFDDGNHDLAGIQIAGPLAAPWGVFESRIESSSLTVSATNEGKEFTTYECTVSWFIPGLTASQFLGLHDFEGGKCLMVMVIDNNDATSGTTAPSASFASNKVIGVSNTLQNQDNDSRTQQYCTLKSIEGGTGAAFSDEIGVTVTVGCTQYETPRNYEGVIALDADGLGLTTTI
tara:strand:- start:12517 stop:13140 length:624 start_codon:yes stop_codon:yes gene_type:complete